MSYHRLSVTVDSDHIDFYNQIDPNTSQAIRRLTDILITHNQFLRNINENPVVALDTLLRSLTRTNRKLQVKRVIDDSLVFINFGLLFYLTGLIAAGIGSILSLCFGGVFIVYGVVSGLCNLKRGFVGNGNNL